MSMSPDPAAQRAPLMDYCGGHPALDFVNSLDNRFRPQARLERLPTYAELSRFMTESGLLDPGRATDLLRGVKPATGQAVLAAAHELRETAASILYAHAAGASPKQRAIQRLEKFILAASQHRELSWQSAADAADSRLEWSWGRSGARAELPLWILSVSIAELLLDGARVARVRTCAADTCRWLFLDTSKNHTRRWCDMKVCGNRMKARRFQARREG